MKFQSILLSATFAAVASIACSPGTTGDAGPPVEDDKYCLPTCTEAADCGDPAEDWACETSQCTYVKYFDNGDFCANGDDCKVIFGGSAGASCAANADCTGTICADALSTGDLFCAIGGPAYDCTILGATYEGVDAVDAAGAAITVCVSAKAWTCDSGFCTDPDAEPTDAGSGDGTCEENADCETEGYECVVPN